MTFNLWTFLFEIVNFVVLAYFLHRLLYRPLRTAIDERREANARAQAEAEKAHADAIAMQEKLQCQLTELEQQRQDSIQKTRQLAEAERQKLLVEGEKAAQRRQEEVRLAIQREREDALRLLRAEVNASAIELAERLLREATSSTLQQQLASHVVEALTQLSESQRAQVRNDWNNRDGAVVETAATMDAVSLQEINEAVNAVMGQAVSLAVETKPALLAGVRLRIGGHVWDASLAGQLEAVRPGGAEGQTHA
jgi:F-type H+-transporting ATPase subunit b